MLKLLSGNSRKDIERRGKVMKTANNNNRLVTGAIVLTGIAVLYMILADLFFTKFNLVIPALALLGALCLLGLSRISYLVKRKR